MSLPPQPKRTVSEDDLDRLKDQREQSDSRYDEALTTLDGALWPLPEFPHPSPPPDEVQVTPLNERWEILRARPAARTGWRGRLARFIWALVEPALTEQQAFNATVVDHVNRNVHPQRETAKAIASTLATVQQQLELSSAFHSTLLQYLQRITPFVNSKDYEFAALAQRRQEDVQSDVHSMHRSLRGLTAAVHGLSDELLRHVESLTARAQRYDARIENARQTAEVVLQQTTTLGREVAKLTAAPPSGVRPGAAVSAPTSEAEKFGSIARASTLAGDQPLESWKYPGFEAAFRGSEREISQRLQDYLPVFAGTADVLDIGCGRGEFLDLLKAKGISARGLDLNFEMVELCRARGLDVSHGDVLSHLRQTGDGSIGGLFAAQVVEHLTPDYLLAFLNEAQRTLRPGAPLVLETINVGCWSAYFQSYIRDITHATPLHPDTLRYLVTASGFASAEVQFRVPVAEAERLQRAPALVWSADGDDREALIALAETMNNNAERLNALLFTHLDYAVIARRA